MSTVAQAGLPSVSVTSGAQVDLLSSSTAGIGINKSVSWRLCVTTNQEITVRVFISAGKNCGLTLVSGYTTTVSAGSQLIISESEFPLMSIRVTAIATSTTATVNCDFLAISSFSN